jgi:hypothetical protein
MYAHSSHQSIVVYRLEVIMTYMYLIRQMKIIQGLLFAQLLAQPWRVLVVTWIAEHQGTPLV